MHRTALLPLALSTVILACTAASCGDDGSPASAGAAGVPLDSGPETAAGAGGAGADAGGAAGSPSTGGSAGTGGQPEASIDAPIEAGTCGQLITFETGLVPDKFVHVAPSGNDQTGDGSEASPYLTIGRGVKSATPGTAVRIHAGTYPGGTYLQDVQGEAGAPIWIGGAPGESIPVIEAGGEALHFTRARYVIVHDLEAHSQTSNGINADDGGDYANAEASRFVVFRNLTLHDIGSGGNQDCLKLSGLNDYFVLNSIFARCGGGSSGSGIDHVGCHHGLIARNQFSQNSGNAVQCKGGSEDIEIRANTLIEPGERGVNLGGSTGFEFFRPPLSTTAPNAEARDIRVIANVIVGGIAPVAYVGCDGCLVANNTIINPSKWILRILQETVTQPPHTFVASRNGRFVNNLVWFSSASVSTHVNIGPDTDAASFLFANNLWYAHDNPSQSSPTLPVTEQSGVVGQDPGLANPAQQDYAIGASSPAAGKGTVVAGVHADFTGRCYKGPPSIGAFEVP